MQACTLSSLKRDLFQIFVAVWLAWVFITLLVSGDTPFVEGGDMGISQWCVPGELIQIYGDWASDAYKCYLEFSEDAKLRVAREMVSSLPGAPDS